MAQDRISAVIIEPDSIPLPTIIDNDLLALNRAVNINRKGDPHDEFASFEISEIKDGINIISSPKGEERSLPVTRTIGRYLKFYGIIYLVKMDGYNLVSMSTDEVVEYCRKFLFENISLEDLGLPSVDNIESDNRSTSYRGRLEITCDDW